MKKFVALGLVLVMLMSLTACAVNVQWFDTKWNFSYAYVLSPNGWKEFKITKWKNFDESDMVQFVTADGNTILGHASTIILAEKRIDFN